MALALTAERAALLAALSAVLKAVESKNTIPILGHLLLRASGDGLTVTGTDLDVQVTAQLPATVEVAGAVTVPAVAFRDLVKRAADKGSVRIVEDGVRRSVTLSAGRARATVPALSVEDFPDLARIAQANFTHGFDLAGVELAAAFDGIGFAISTEETRYYLNGIYCHVVEDEGRPALRLVATDGHRLARCGRAAPGGLGPDMPGVIIPRKAVALIRDLAKGAGEGGVRIDLSESAVRASAGGLTVASKLIDGTFPDYQRVIPAGGDRTARVPVKPLARILEFCTTLGLDRTRAVKMEFADGQLTVSLRNAEGGFVTDEVEIEFEGRPFEMGVNGAYLGEILEKVGADIVTMRVGPDPASPALIGNDLDAGLYVLMPMRV